jgi:uncharacterized protein
MKLVVLLVVVVAVLWLARSARRHVRPTQEGGAARPAQEAMVACRQCGVHLPRSEALPGRGGLFCCEAHRSDFERADRAG